MANYNTPYGLQPVQRLDGAVWNNSLRTYYVPASQTNALFVGDPVIKIAASADVNGVNGVDLAAAGTNNQITGVVCGFVGACVAGAPGGPTLSQVGMFRFSGMPGNAYRPASTTLDYYVLVNDDPEAQFYIQENDNYGGVAGTPLPVSAVGKNANLIAGTGNIYTGWSGWMLNSNAIAATNTYQLRIIGFTPNPVGAPGSAYGKVIVQINGHTELPHQAGI
jgi:hypothetical protein